MSKKDIIEEIHKPARINYPRRHVVVKGLLDLFQADLVEMIPYAKINKGYKYILTLLDVFSKRAWTIPVKLKTGENMAAAMYKIFKTGQIPKLLQTDNGREFYNANFQNLIQKYKIRHYNTFSTMKASVLERFNRTPKAALWKHFSLTGSYEWINDIDKIVYDIIIITKYKEEKAK